MLANHFEPCWKYSYHHVLKVSRVEIDDAVHLFAVNLDIVDEFRLNVGLTDFELCPLVHWHYVINVVSVGDFVIDVTGDVEFVLARIERNQRHSIAGASVVVTRGGKVQQVHPRVVIGCVGHDVNLHVPDAVEVRNDSDQMSNFRLVDTAEPRVRRRACDSII